MKEFKSFAKRAATIFLAIAIICTSSGFDQLTTIAAETSEQPRLTTEVAPAEAAPAAEQPVVVTPAAEQPVAVAPVTEQPVVVAPTSGEESSSEDETPVPEAPTPELQEETPAEEIQETPSDDTTKDEELVVEVPVADEEVVTTTYKVSFVGFEGTDLGTVEVEEGQAATSPEAPAVDGYTFTGWDADVSAVTSDMTVTAQYKLNEEVKTFVVTFLGMDDSILGTAEVIEGATVAEDVIPEAPVVEGYTFTGWDKDFSAVTEDMTVKAVYEEANMYVVTFLGMNEEILGTAEVKSGETVAEELIPELPEVAGYTSTGWDKDFSVVTEDMTVKAAYEIFPEFNASVTVDGVVISAFAEEGIIEPGASLTAEIVALTDAQENKIDEVSSLEDISVKHAFDINIIGANGDMLQPVFGEDVKITFSNVVELEGVDADSVGEVVYVADDASAAEVKSEIIGADTAATFDAEHFSIYVYVGKIDKNAEYTLSGTHAYYYDPSYTPAPIFIEKQPYFRSIKDIKGKIRFVNKSDQVRPDSALIMLEEIKGYQYTGNAYYNKQAFDLGDERFSTTVKISYFKIDKKHVYAVDQYGESHKIDYNDIIWEYTKPVTVSYKTGNSEKISPVVAFPGKSITLPTPKDVDKKSFSGWYDGSNIVGEAGDSYTVPTKDITLTAKWDNLHQLIFQTNGGTLSGIKVDAQSSIWVKKGSEIFLPQVSKTGYNFGGWYKDNSFNDSHKVGLAGDKYTISNISTLFAKWDTVILKVNFTYRDDSHTEITVQQDIEYNKSAISPVISSLRMETSEEYYKFKGWDDKATPTTENYSSDYINKLKVTENKTYIAIYDVQPKKVMFFVAKTEGQPEDSTDEKDFDLKISYEAKINSYFEEKDIPADYFSIITENAEVDSLEAAANDTRYSNYTIHWYRMVKRSDGYHIDGYKVEKTNISDLIVSDIAAVTYTGKPQTPVVVKDGDITLFEGTDYTVTYSDNTNVGTATATIIGKGKYTGTITKKFQINPAILTVTAKPASKTFGEADPIFEYIVGTAQNGEIAAVNPDALLTRKDAGSEGGENAGEYEIYQGTLVLDNNGTFKVSNYELKFISADFTINAKSILSSGISVEKIIDRTYNSNEHMPMPEIKDGDKVLSFDTDYELKYENNINAGTATVTVVGMGNYGLNNEDDTLKVTFNINKAKASITIANASKTVGSADPSFTATVVMGEIPEIQKLVYSLKRTPGEAVGQYPITADYYVMWQEVVAAMVENSLIENDEDQDDGIIEDDKTLEDGVVSKDNFDITVVPGTLTINAAPAPDYIQEQTPPTTPPTTTTITPPITPAAPALPPSNIVIDEAPVALAARPANITPVEATVEEEEEVVADDEVTIEEEETPLADEVTEIEEEETPLAVPVDNCMIHWMILILTALYAIYEIVRGFARKKKINELTDSESFGKSDANA